MRTSIKSSQSKSSKLFTFYSNPINITRTFELLNLLEIIFTKLDGKIERLIYLQKFKLINF